MNYNKYINETTHILQFNTEELLGCFISKESNDDGTYHLIIKVPIYEELHMLCKNIMVTRFPIFSDKPCGKLKGYYNIDIPRCEIEGDESYTNIIFKDKEE